MEMPNHIEWDPHLEPPPHGALLEYDRLRRQCPVARGSGNQWYVFRHEDVMKVLLDHETFSNVVSQRVSAPNGMDPPEHTPIRKLIEQFFLPELMADFWPVCSTIADEMMDQALAAREVEVMSSIGYPYAARAQCAFLGWPEEMSQLLIAWTIKNQQAAREKNREVLDTLGAQFDDLVRQAIEGTAHSERGGITRRLTEAEVNGRRLRPDELASILRNWTVGEIGSLAASIGILLHALAEDPGTQQILRETPGKQANAIEEMLRVHGPLISNRRRATRDVELGGRQVRAGDTVHVIWVSANRDEAVFEAPCDVQIERDNTPSLLYGAGIHVCPGAPLARLEMRLLLERCLAKTRRILPIDATPSVPAAYPASGYSSVSVRMDG